MNLIALCCTKCGAPLSFSGSLICSCSSCGTPHALVDTGFGLMQSVSYLPYKPRTDGKMSKSLKILLAEKVRDLGLVTHSPGYYSETNLRIGDDGKTVYNQYFIEDDDKGFTVAQPRLERGVIKTVSDGWLGEKDIYGDIPKCTDLYVIKVIPVKVIDSGVEILAGFRVVIEVEMPKFEEEANQMSEKIQEWFEIIPEVNLANG